MTAPLGTTVPSLVVSSVLAPALQTQTLILQETSADVSRRYVLAGSLAAVALGTVLSGCRSDPAPAPIPHESALPANQGNCPPNSRDPFCQGYKASVEEMRRHREDGHHTDQALTGILVGLAIFLVAVPTSIIIWKRGRRIKRLEAELKAARPPESGDHPRRPGFFSRIFRRAPKAATVEPSSGNPPADSPQNAKKVGS